MFVPSESVYAELYDGFDDVIQKAYRAQIVLVLSDERIGACSARLSQHHVRGRRFRSVGHPEGDAAPTHHSFEVIALPADGPQQHAPRAHAVHEPVGELIAADFQVLQRLHEIFSRGWVPDGLADDASARNANPQLYGVARFRIHP